MKKQSNWEWFYPYDQSIYIRKASSLLPWFVALIVWANPESVGHWAGNVAHAFKEAF